MPDDPNFKSQVVSGEQLTMAAVIEPCKGRDALESCHSAEAIRASGMRFIPEASEICPVCGHVRARRT